VWKLFADVLDHHRRIVDDQARSDAFYEAISAVVRPGDVVVDIGTGTGLLAIFAAQAGARRVYALETGAIADVAEQLVAANGFGAQVRIIRGSSLQVDLPEKADVVVSETLGDFGLGEGIVRTMADAKRRFLKPGGALIPGSFDLRLAPIEHPSLHAQLQAWRRPRLGVDFSCISAQACNNVYRSHLTPDMLLSDPETLCHVRLGEDTAVISGSCEFIVRRGGVIHALGGWFHAELASGYRIDNQPPNQTSWKHAVLPVERPILVEPGDLVRAEVQCIGDESAWRWSVSHYYRNALPTDFRTTRLSTLRGFPTAVQRLSAG
jgi:protein arginine N-methyltransferase 1